MTFGGVEHGQNACHVVGAHNVRQSVSAARLGVVEKLGFVLAQMDLGWVEVDGAAVVGYGGGEEGVLTPLVVHFI